MVYSNFRCITVRQGFVESKIRQLLMRIEMVDGIILAHPFNSSFDKIHYCTTDDEAAQVATGEMIKHLRTESTDLQKSALAAVDGAEGSEDVSLPTRTNITVYTSTFYIGLNISSKDGKIPCPLFGPHTDDASHSCHRRNPEIGYLLALSRVLRHLPPLTRLQ